MQDSNLQTAIAALEAGELDIASVKFKQYLKFQPDDAQGWYLLGMVHFQLNKNEIAVEYIQRAIQKNPQSAQFHCSLGLCFETLEQIKNAESSYQTAITIRPDVFQVYYDYGCFLQKQQRQLEAIKHFEKTLELEPEHAPSHVNLGSLYHQQQNLNKAEINSRRAFELIPENTAIAINLVKVLLDQGKFEEAEQSVNRVLVIDSQYIPAQVLSGSIQYLQGNKNAAAEIFSSVLNQDEGNIDALSQLAKCYTDNEKYVQAEKLLKKALENSNDDIGSIIHLGELYSYQSQFDEAEKILHYGIGQHPNSAKLHFATGITNTQQGKFDLARENFLTALKLDQNYLEALHAVTKITQYSDLKHIEVKLALSKANEINHNKVFINQQNRINLYFALGKIYDDIGNYQEAFDYYKLGNELKYTDNKYDINEFIDFNEQTYKVFTSELIHKPSLSIKTKQTPVFILGMPRSGTTLLEQILSSHSNIYGAGELPQIQIISKQFKQYPVEIKNLDEVQTALLRKQYINKITTLDLQPDESMVIDKNPINFRYIGLIKNIFPDAKIIHLQRHPLDVVLSIYFQRFTHGHSFAFNLDQIAGYYTKYQELMRFWEECFRTQIYSCRYDDLIMNTRQTAEKVLHYLDLDWQESCLQFHQQQRKVDTASGWQVRQPVYQDSIERWENYSEQLKNIRLQLDPEITLWKKGATND